VETVTEPACEKSSTEVSISVTPQLSSCKESNAVTIEVFNGSCTQDLFVEEALVFWKSLSDCSDFPADLLPMGETVEPQETRIWVWNFSWCCSNCSDFTCGWKLEAEVETDRRVYKAESEKFRKSFSDTCPSCSAGPDSAAAPAQCGDGNMGVQIGREWQ